MADEKAAPNSLNGAKPQYHLMRVRVASFVFMTPACPTVTRQATRLPAGRFVHCP